jgi:hypothetical protein
MHGGSAVKERFLLVVAGCVGMVFLLVSFSFSKALLIHFVLEFFYPALFSFMLPGLCVFSFLWFLSVLVLYLVPCWLRVGVFFIMLLSCLLMCILVEGFTLIIRERCCVNKLADKNKNNLKYCYNYKC